MAEPTCGTCRWWDPETLGMDHTWSTCQNAETRQRLMLGGTWHTRSDFGCNQHEPQPTDWRALALELRAAGMAYTRHLVDVAGTRAVLAGDMRAEWNRWHAAVAACPDDTATAASSEDKTAAREAGGR